MNIIEYNPIDGEVVPDGKIQEWVENVVDIILIEKECYFLVGSELMIDALRLAILKGKIDYRNVQFKFEDRYIEVNEYGKLSFYPVNTHSKLLIALVQGASQKRKSKNNEKIV